MDDTRELLRHFLAALAYRTQKALRGAHDGFGDFRAVDDVRTPAELVRHMTSVLGYAGTFFIGGKYDHPQPLPSFQDDIVRFHNMLEDLSRYIANDAPLLENMTEKQLLQGPFSDAMTHAGQLAMLRRIAGTPVAPENFLYADITSDRLGVEQADPALPDEVWPEAPPDWVSPSNK